MFWFECNQPTSRAVRTYFPEAPASVFGLRCVLAKEEQVLQADGWRESW